MADGAVGADLEAQGGITPVTWPPTSGEGMPAGSLLWWLDRLDRALVARQKTIQLADDYYEGKHRLQFATPKFREAFGDVFKAFADNWCEIVVNAVEERLTVQGFRFAEGAQGPRGRARFPRIDSIGAGDTAAWDIWQRNNLDAGSKLCHLESFIGGEASTLVWPSEQEIDGQRVPEITIEHASQMIVATAPGNIRRRLAAYKRWDDDDGTIKATLYLPDGIYKFEVPNYRSRYSSSSTQLVRHVAAASWQRREARDEEWPLPNPLGIVPVVPFPNRPRLLKPGRAEHWNVIPVQDAVNKTIADLLVASEFGALPRRWATSLELPSNPETGQKLTSKEVEDALGRLFINPKDGRFGTFESIDLKMFVAVVEMFVQHIASESRTPPHYFYLKGEFPSGEVLHVEEPLLTANRGWVTMGTVVPGDVVFGTSGQPVEVLKAHGIYHGRPCFRVCFDDGSAVIADATHRWRTLSLPGTQTDDPRVSKTLTTEEISRTLRLGNVGNGRSRQGLGAARHAVVMAAPLELPEAELPVDPWVLGYWLGNGHRRAGSVSCHVDDARWLAARIELAGYAATIVPIKGRAVTVNIRSGLRRALAAAGVWGNKHIPAAYFAASAKQRLALLQGILDADGSVDSQGRATIDLNNEQLATDVQSLAVSHGQKVRLRKRRGKSTTPDGKMHEYDRWRIAWTPSIEAFAMPRKVERLRLRETGTARLRYIVDVEPVASVPVRCITVDSADHLFLIGRALVPTHNSIKSAETGLVKKSLDTMLFRGESWEETMRLAFAVAEDERSRDFGAETIWADPESRTFSEHMDGLMKQQALGVPDEILWEKAGYSPSEIERIKAIRAANPPSARVEGSTEEEA